MGDDHYQIEKDRYSTCQGVLRQNFFFLNRLIFKQKFCYRFELQLYLLWSVGPVIPAK